jgi:hypothetical protein
VKLKLLALREKCALLPEYPLKIDVRQENAVIIVCACCLGACEKIPDPKLG